MSFLVVKNMKKSFQKKELFHNVSFEVDRGEILVVKGASGCGKTTLLKILAGLEKMDFGTYFLNGENLSEGNDNRFAQLRSTDIGYIPQSYELINDLTVYENIMLPLWITKSQEPTDYLEKLIAETGLLDVVNRKVKDLSGGEKQRVAICRAFIFQPKVLLIDEPTSALDEQNKEIFYHIIEKKRDDCATIITTHDTDILRFANEIYVLE